MSLNDQLPQEIEALHALILEKDKAFSKVNDQLQKASSKLQRTNTTLESANTKLQKSEDEISKLRERNTFLKTQITARDRIISQMKEKARLQRAQRFGPSSEKLHPDTFQLVMEDLETDIAQARKENEAEEDEQTKEKKKPKRKPKERKQKPFPKTLHRKVKILKPKNKTCPCGKGMKQIGVDTSEQLAWRPCWYILETQRPIYACSCGKGGVRQERAPDTEDQLFKRIRVSESALAHFVVSKFEDHLPLYRQSKMMAREGIHISRGTLSEWMGDVAAHFTCLYDALKANLLSSSKLFMDETTLPVLDPGKKKTKTGYLWAVARDERPYNGSAPPGAFFCYAPGRSSNEAEEILGDYNGRLQVDGHGAYPKLAARLVEKGKPSPVLVQCWAHSRRKFHDLVKSGTPSPIAEEALIRIGELYDIERDIRGKDADIRTKVRQDLSKPLVTDFWEWADAQSAKVSPKSTLGLALKYMLARQSGLSLFLDDGCLEMDTNVVENAIRPSVITRKNSLFAGNDAGAHRWAMFTSFMVTARMNGINPEEWFEKTMIAMGKWHPNNKIHMLLPFRQEDLDRIDAEITKSRTPPMGAETQAQVSDS